MPEVDYVAVKIGFTFAPDLSLKAYFDVHILPVMSIFSQVVFKNCGLKELML